MEEETDPVEVGIGIEMVDSRGVERTRSPDDTVHFIALGEEQFSEVGAILARDPSDEGFFHYHYVPKIILVCSFEQV